MPIPYYLFVGKRVLSLFIARKDRQAFWLVAIVLMINVCVLILLPPIGHH